MRDAPPVIDPTPSLEEFASGLYRAERIGDVMHLVFYVNQVEATELGGGIGRRLTRRLVLPNDAIARMIRQLEAARDGQAGAIDPEVLPGRGH